MDAKEFFEVASCGSSYQITDDGCVILTIDGWGHKCYINSKRKKRFLEDSLPFLGGAQGGKNYEVRQVHFD